MQVYRNTPTQEDLLGEGRLQVPPPGESIEAWYELAPPGNIGERPRVQATVISGLRRVDRRGEDELAKSVAEVRTLISFFMNWDASL